MKFQVTMLNVLLLVTATAVGFALWLQHSENEMYAQQLPGLRNEARELFVEDPTLIHVVEPHPEWFGEKKWNVYIPDQPEFKIMLVTAGIQSTDATDASYSSERSAILPPGRHTIELVQNKLNDETFEIKILIDEKTILALNKDKLWKPNECSTSSSNDTGECKSFLNEEKIVLNRSRFKPMNKVLKPDDERNGILLWIEKSEP